jgi:hypothetical protein
MRGFTVGVAASALDADPKWLDNLVSHHHVAGVRQSGRGVARAIEVEGLRTIAVALLLMRRLACPTTRALALASQLLAGGGSADDDLLTVRVDVGALDSRLTERLINAAETAPARRRGRPRKVRPPNPSAGR